MPTESLGLDSRMAAMDMDPKGLSPMSAPEDNMSSPPSVLTTASAGSTPSSIPSAGSTPSSIPSAGSTPYQYNTHEDMKPITPSSDHQPITPVTPGPNTPDPSIPSDQPITPDQHFPRSPDCYIPSPEPSRLKTESIEENENLMHNAEFIGHGHGEVLCKGAGYEHRREDCSCILCEDHRKCNAQVNISQVKEIEKSPENKGEKFNLKELQIKAEKLKDSTLLAKRKRTKSNVTMPVVTYASQISQNSESTGIKMTIKLCKPTSGDSGIASASVVQFNQGPPPLKSSLKGRGRGRGKRKAKYYEEDIDFPGPEVGKKRKKTTEKFTEWGPVCDNVDGEPQSDWGYRLPPIVLRQILINAVDHVGCIPLLLRTSRVCRLWREASTDYKLWHTVDLATGRIKPKNRNERRLLWILENRLPRVVDLNLDGWVDAVTAYTLSRLPALCPKIEGLNLSRCHKLHSENIHSLLSPLQHLQRLDLTDIMGSHKPTSRCALGQQTLTDLACTVKERLTHLTLAHNTLANVPSVVRAFAEHCPNIEHLDLSNVVTVGRDPITINLEQLQAGCNKIRVLRFTNTNVKLLATSMQEQAASPGFPDLEEFSIAVDGIHNIGFKDDDIDRVLKTSSKLRLLDVRGCLNITDSSLVRIAPFDLEHLFLAGSSTPKSYSDRLELIIQKWCHSLVELDLSWTANSNGNAIDCALQTLSEEPDNKLRILNLCGSSVNFPPLRKILLRCKHLEFLNLTSCRALPRGLKRLHQGEQIESLIKDINIGKYDEKNESDDD